MGLDPLNAAAAFIPVVGEARYARWLAQAGGLGERVAIRAGVGAARGAAGNIPLVAMHYGIAQETQEDYTAANALLDIAYGAAFGAVLHTGLGPVTERGMIARERARIEAEGLTGTSIPAAEQTPLARTIEAAPLEVKEGALRSSIAAAAEDRPVAAADVLHTAGVATPEAILDPELTLFHGSPHDFDRFSSEHIGTGEGAQSYGHGLYFAENEGVARGYAEKLAPGRGEDAKGLAASVMQADGIDGDPAKAMAELDSRVASLPASSDGREAFATKVEEAKRAIKDGSWKEKLYKVGVRARDGAFLDWDKPLSEQTPEVQAALRALGVFDHDLIDAGSTGQDAYLALGDRKQAAQRLREAGIPGLKYLDQGSRGVGEGTRNYVLFDDNLIRILEKNGQAVADRAAEAMRAAGEPPLGLPGTPLPDPSDAAVQRAAEEVAPKGGPRVAEDPSQQIKEAQEKLDEDMKILDAAIKQGMPETELEPLRTADLMAEHAEARARGAQAAALCLPKGI
jgi:hypothetical protein